MLKNWKLLLYDILLLLSSLYIALCLKFGLNIPGSYMNFYKLSIIPVLVITITLNKIFNLYDNIWEYASVKELMSIIYSITISNVIFFLYSYIIYNIFNGSYVYRFPFTVNIIFWLLSVITLGAVRLKYRFLYEMNNSPQPDSEIRILIVGAGDAALMLLKEIKKHNELKYNVVGLIDDDNKKVGMYISSCKILGGRNDIISICSEEKIDDIIFAIPSIAYEDKREIFDICKKTNCKLRTVPGIYEILDNKINVSKIRDIKIDDLLGRDEVKLDTNNIAKFINGKTVLVTGGGGSIGSELCRQLAKYKPKKLLILDIYENNAYDLQMQLNYSHPELNKEVIIASIRDYDRLANVFIKYKPDVVFHAAAHKHVPLMEANPAEAIKNNIIGTFNVLKCSNDYKVKKFVQISTDKAVNPTNVMGATKRYCEIMIQAFDKISDTEFVAVRFGNVLGSNGSVIPLFKKQIERGGPITVTHPDINRYFMTIPEAAQLVIQAGGMANGGEIFILDMGEPVKIVDLAKDMIKLSGLEPGKDIKIEYTGLRPGEKLYEELLMDKNNLISTSHNMIFVEKPSEFEISDVYSSIEEFRNAAYKDKEEIIRLLGEKVVTYKRVEN